VSEWTAKKSAALGVVLTGTSIAFLIATAIAMSWQPRPGQEDWGMIFGFAFGIPFICCGVAALLCFLVSLSLITYRQFFGMRPASPITQTAGSELPRRKVRHPAIVTLAGFAMMVASAKFGSAAVFLVGIPMVLVASAIAGGARSPTQIPLRDAILYFGISVAIVVAILMYVIYHH
jgi:hypothetical protein